MTDEFVLFMFVHVLYYRIDQSSPCKSPCGYTRIWQILMPHS